MITLASWHETWRSLGVPQADDALFRQLVTCWSEPHRRYHTLQHLRECFERFDEARRDAARPAEIELALWFHDAYYDPHRDDNEARSAVWSRDAALKCGASHDVAQRLYDMVMATVHDGRPITDSDTQLLVDIDLSILGAEAARFDESDAQIREEYGHVPEAEYKEGRRRVLRGFLDRPRLYGTERFHGMLEARARDNLQRALARLG